MGYDGRNKSPLGSGRRCAVLGGASGLALLIWPFLGVANIVTGTFGDAVWTHDPISGVAGRHTVDASTYQYDIELYELPVKASGWVYDGDPNATSGTTIMSGEPGDKGIYYAYADLTQAVVSTNVVGSVSEWLIRISVAADHFWDGDKGSPESPVGLKGKYSVYFGQFGPAEHWLFYVNDGSGMTSGYSTTNVKLYQEATDAPKRPPYGTGIDTTFDDDEDEKNFTGYESEISLNTGLTGRTLYDPGNDVFDIELRYIYSGPGAGPISQSVLENLDYFYIGVAVSNPSGPNDFFANDHFTQNGSTSAEYDTILLVPEPGSAVLLAVGALGLALRRRRE